jgi:glutathione S-transferase
LDAGFDSNSLPRALAGDQFTIADIPAGASLYRYFGMQIERPSIPCVEAWYRRLAERPPYREHVMVPFEDLRGRLAYGISHNSPDRTAEASRNILAQL